MFGYIKPVQAELKVKEYELYRSIYCGLCDALGRTSTCTSRLTLSYDFVFLALVRMAITGKFGKIEQKRCAVHPMKKRSHLVGADELDYCARVSALLTYHKLRDDISDEHGAKRLGAKILLPEAARMRKRALAGLTELDREISERLSELARLENERLYSPDRAAEPFGELMAQVLSHGLDGSDKRIASELGRHVGRFIYITDAADDFTSDLESGAYNPFRIEGADDETVKSEFKRRESALVATLVHELEGAARAIELIDCEERAVVEIIKNTVYLALPEIARRAAKGDGTASKPEKSLTENNI